MIQNLLLDKIKKDSRLSPYINDYIPPSGYEDSQIIFVGEAGGAEEEKLKQPFVGRSGQLLDKLFQDLGIIRQEVYITNVVKRRPTNNDFTTVQPDELQAWKELLLTELQLLASNSTQKFIVSFGNNSWSSVEPLKPFLSLYKIDKIYHPSYILRNGGYGTETYKIWKKSLLDLLFNA